MIISIAFSPFVLLVAPQVALHLCDAVAADSVERTTRARAIVRLLPVANCPFTG
jgi:hypothetical protein